MPGVDVDGMRRAWREERSPSLKRRRAIAALAAAGMTDFRLRLTGFMPLPGSAGRRPSQVLRNLRAAFRAPAPAAGAGFGAGGLASCEGTPIAKRLAGIQREQGNTQTIHSPPGGRR